MEESTTITLRYGKLSSASTDAGTISTHMETYGSDLQTRVIDRLTELSDQDGVGYIAAAIDYCNAKNRELSALRDRIDQFKTSIDTLYTDAQAADSQLVTDIRATAGAYVGERKWYEQAGDWLYGTFCVDLPGVNPVTKYISDCTKSVVSPIPGVLSSIHVWFTYKEGKYVWDGVRAVAGTVGAGAAAVGAIAIAATPIGWVAAGAAVVIFAICVINTSYRVAEDVNALGYANRDEPGKARYHGNADSFSEYYKRTDMGGSSENRAWQTAGSVIDTTQKVAKGVKFVAGDVGSLFAHKAFDGKINGYSLDDFKKNIREMFGFKAHSYVIDSKTGRKKTWFEMSSQERARYQEKGEYRFTQWNLSDMFKKKYFSDKDSIVKKVKTTLKNMKSIQEFLAQSGSTESYVETFTSVFAQWKPTKLLNIFLSGKSIAESFG